MTAHNPAEVERLIAEAREDDGRMTRAPWTTPCGGRLLGSVSAIIDGIERQVAASAGQAPQFDEVPDVGRALADNSSGIARTRNNLAAIADQLQSARTAIENLQGMERAATAIRLAESRAVLQQEQELEAARAEIARLRADVLRLTETARAAADSWMSACRQRDDARAEVSALRNANHLASQLTDARTSVIDQRKSYQAEAERVLGIPPRAGGYSPAEVVEAIREVVVERDRLRGAVEAIPNPAKLFVVRLCLHSSYELVD